MSETRRRFDPSEIDLDPDLEPRAAELVDTARDLEAYASTGLVVPTVGFEDRVMAAIADEPMPRPAGRSLLGTARDAWAIAFGPDRPVLLRAQAFAMLLALGLAIGSVGAVAVVGAARLLSQEPTPPTVPTPMPSPSPSVTPSPTPSSSIDPSPSPTAGPTTSPQETAEPSGADDHGGGGSGGSGSGSGGGGGTDDSGHSGSGSSGSGSSGSSGTSGGSGSDDTHEGSSGGSSGSGSDDSPRSSSGHDG